MITSAKKPASPLFISSWREDNFCLSSSQRASAFPLQFLATFHAKKYFLQNTLCSFLEILSRMKGDICIHFAFHARRVKTETASLTHERKPRFAFTSHTEIRDWKKNRDNKWNRQDQYSLYSAWCTLLYIVISQPPPFPVFKCMLLPGKKRDNFAIAAPSGNFHPPLIIVHFAVLKSNLNIFKRDFPLLQWKWSIMSKWNKLSIYLQNSIKNKVLNMTSLMSVLPSPAPLPPPFVLTN